MSAESTDSPNPRFFEFIALMAVLTSLVAMSIDAMLPALSDIGRDLGVVRDNDNQLVVSLLFLGMAAGQIFYGPLSDSVGRKPAIFAGLSLFAVGCILSIVAQSFVVMLVGRLLQGLGVASPRVVVVAVVRDQFEGRAMARVMSFVMAVFILVPVMAPSLGQAILTIANWRAIFAFFLVLSIAIGGWFGFRQPETHAANKRTPFSIGLIGRGMKQVVLTRRALGYTIAAGMVFGAFVGYLSTAPQIFQEQYGLGDRFPLYFAGLSLALGAASLVNARLVLSLGMERLVRWALVWMASWSLIFLVCSIAYGGHPPLGLFSVYLVVVFFAEGTLYGNLNALAMEPLGRIAGVGAAVVGALSTFLSILGGGAIGQAYDGTVHALVAGFLMLSLVALVVVQWTEHERGSDGAV